MASTKYPAYADSADALYNVPAYPPESPPGQCRRICSVKDPPPLRWCFADHFQMREALEAWFGPATGLGVFWKHAFAIGEPAEDRTLQIWVADLDALNGPLLTKLQKWLRDEWPLWRIVLLTEDSTDAITMYPRVLRIGVEAPKPGADIPKQLAALVKRCKAQRAAVPDLVSEQREIVQQRFLELRNAGLDADACGVLAVFDVHPSDDSYDAVWVYYPGRDEIDLDVAGAYWAGAFAYENGRLHEYPVTSGHDFYVRLIAIPHDSKSEIVLTESEKKRKNVWNLGTLAKLRKKHRVVL